MDNGEFRTPPEEFDKPPLEYRTAPEFYETYGSGEGKKKKKKKKRSTFLNIIRTNAILPVAAAIASVSVLASSLGSSLLGVMGISGSPSGSAAPPSGPVDSYVLIEYELPSEAGYFDGTNVVSALLYAEDGVTVTDGNGDPVSFGAVEGASFDEYTKTLYVHDLFCDYILFSGIGNVTVSVSGTASNVGRIESKGGGNECGITLVPETPSEDPVLTFSPRTEGYPCIAIHADGSGSALTFGSGLTVFMYSGTAVAIYGTTAPSGIVTESGLIMSLGRITVKSGSGGADVSLECTGGEYDPVSVEVK